MRIQDFSIIKGDTSVIALTIYDSDDSAVDLTSYSTTDLSFIVYSGDTAVITKIIGTGITVTGATSGAVSIVLSATDTAALTAGARYTYAAIISDGTTVYTVTSGVLKVTSPRVASMYCQPADVASQLRLKDTSTGTRLAFTSSTDPTYAEVEAWIDEASNYIDRETNHAFRFVTAVNEYHAYKGQYDGIWKDVRIPLNHRSVQTFSHALGDKLELFDFTTYVDLLADDSYVEGEDDDYYVDYTNGHIIFVGTKPYVHPLAVRVTYRYGESSVPYDIREACTKLVAIRYLESELYTATVPNGPGLSPSKETIIEKWQADVDRILARRSEMPVMNL